MNKLTDWSYFHPDFLIYSIEVLHHTIFRMENQIHSRMGLQGRNSGIFCPLLLAPYFS